MTAVHYVALAIMIWGYFVIGLSFIGLGIMLNNGTYGTAFVIRAWLNKCNFWVWGLAIIATIVWYNT